MSRLKYFLFVFIIFIFVSCEESFDPFTDFKQDYGVACVLRADTTLQLTSIFKSYPSGSQNNFLFEDSADVRIWYADSVYRLKDTTIITDEYPSGLKQYYTNKFKIDYDEEIEIEIVLSDGKRIKGKSKTPSEVNFTNLSEVIVPPVGRSVIQIFWTVAGNENFYIPRLRIKCETTENGIKRIFYRELPQKYISVNGIETPSYPKASRNPAVVYDLDALNKYLTAMAAEFENPSAIVIHQSLELDLITYDFEVSRYISSMNSELQNLSIRFDASDYTNIDGGFGIFGSQILKKYTRLNFLENYIRSFGFDFLFDI